MDTSLYNLQSAFFVNGGTYDVVLGLLNIELGEMFLVICLSCY